MDSQDAFSEVDRAQSAMKNAELYIEKAIDANEKEAKQYARKIIWTANEVVVALGGFAAVHPASQAAVEIFKGVVKLEVERQENNVQIAAVFYSMTSYMFHLRHLDPVLRAEDGLTDLHKNTLGDISKTMKDFGNFASLYYKMKQRIFHLLRSAQYKKILSSFETSFRKKKDDLDELLRHRTVVKAHHIHGKVSEIHAKIDLIISKLGKGNAQEELVMGFIDEQGGPNKVINNDECLGLAAEKLGEKLTSPLKIALREDLEVLLEENMAQFNLKIDDATRQITDAVERSKDAILLRLDAGPYELIVDPDVRIVWQEMQWRSNIKCRPFVDALHEHFEHKFRLNASRLEPDRWTLRFLSKAMYHPAIGNAIDEDGSGFVSVHETNSFLQRRPAGWSVPHWLVFWAILWTNNVRWYYENMLEMVQDISKAANNVKEENRKHVNFYITVLGYVKLIVLNSLEKGTSENPHYGNDAEVMIHLQDEYKHIEEQRIGERAKKTDFHLEDKQSLFAVLEQDRVETSLAPLLYLILKRHREIVMQATKVEVTAGVFHKMIETLHTVSIAFHDRLEDLIRGWKQQKEDVTRQVHSFAGGMYQGWYEELPKPTNALRTLEIEYQEFLERGDEEAERLEDNGGAEPDRIDVLLQRVDLLDTRLARIETLLRSLIIPGATTCGPHPFDGPVNGL